LKQSNGTFSEAPSGSGCNPTTPADKATIVSNNNCEIEMNVLRSSPYNFTFDGLLIAKVQALNAIGWSQESSINGVAVARVQTLPPKPTLAPVRASTSSHT
jgi:hypothetical protein